MGVNVTEAFSKTQDFQLDLKESGSTVKAADIRYRQRICCSGIQITQTTFTASRRK